MHRHVVGRAKPLRVKTAFGPVSVRVEGRSLVLWRANGAIVAMDDVCAHRGAPLSSGRVDRIPVDGKEKDCIRCIYHNWAFDGTGRIADIPTQKGADAGRWPKRSVQRSYRVAFEDGDLVVYDAESVSA